MADLYVGIETGGTKVVAGVARFEADTPVLVAPEAVVPTGRDPRETWDAVRAAVSVVASRPEVVGTGIASFGPVDLREGRMLGTPKPGWAGFALADEWRARLDGPVAIETDVNAAAIAEWRWGAARDTDVAAYLTVGTGIGGGIVVGGRPVHGALHPEIGHIRVPRMPGDDFEGSCGAHGPCWEGLTAGPALRGRFGARGESLPPGHEAWGIVTWYVGIGLAQVALAWSPEVIVLGGGVMARALHGPIAERLTAELGGYVPPPRVSEPSFGDRSGLMGAFALAREAAGA